MNKSGKRELIVLTIDLGQKKDEIHVRDTDTPLNLAQEFCKRNNLNTEAEIPISQYISLSLSKLTSPTKPKIPQLSSNITSEIILQAKRLVREKSNAKTPKCSKSMTKSPSKKCTTPRKKLPGERLYYQGLADKKNKEEHAKEIMAEREADEIVQATFRPMINRNSSSRGNRNDDGFMYNDRKMKEKLVFQRIVKMGEEMKICTFKPTVNKMSLMMDKIKTKDRNLHLYLNSRRKTEESPPRTTDRKNRQGGIIS